MPFDLALSTIEWGIVGSLSAGLATGLGGLLVWMLGKATLNRQDLYLGFAAGVMLAASFFSLILPGLDEARAMGASGPQAATLMMIAVLIGGASVALFNQLIGGLPEGGLGTTAIAQASHRQVWVFIAVITLHNLPEGLAVGVSFGGGDLSAGWATAFAIGIQNVPEGLAVAASLVAAGYKRGFAALVALASGLVEPLGGTIGVIVVSLSQALLPWGLGFAAGAMIYVVATDIIPRTQSRVPHGAPAASLMVGLVAMMFLDVAFA